jgi:hypothetical protein
MATTKSTESLYCLGFQDREATLAKKYVNTFHWRRHVQNQAIVPQIKPKLAHQHKIVLTGEQNNKGNNCIKLI